MSTPNQRTRPLRFTPSDTTAAGDVGSKNRLVPGKFRVDTRFLSDRHSLTVFDMDHQSLQWTQIDEWGHEIDQCRITKA